MSAGLITAFADAGGGSTTVTSNGHGLPNLATVFIEDTTSYNGWYEISNVATNTYDIVEAFVANDATGIYVTDTSPIVLGGGTQRPSVTSGSAGAKGSWVHAFTTSEEINWININIDPISNDQGMEIDIGTGLNGAEVVAMTVPCFVNPGPDIVFPPVPIKIAAGIEVKIRIAAQSATQSVGFVISGLPDDSYGTSTANETIGLGTLQGTDIDPGAVNNIMGAKVEISSSTGIEYNYIVVCMANSSNSSQTTQNYLVEMMSGILNSEINIRSPYPFFSGTAEISETFIGVWVTVAQSTRIVARCASDAAAAAGANDRLMDFAVVGFNVTPPAGGSGGIAQIVGSGGIVS